MSAVEKIKAEIDQLSFRERCELNALLHIWPDDEWDKQMRADAESGKLDWMIKEAEDAEARGLSKEFPKPSE
ncbi:MAG: hypothetical protein M3Y82_04290 [Verrucomicrobiota bacterium]|nr:hypothetical protein [Verrucomicrobiota bacterium]